MRYILYKQYYSYICQESIATDWDEELWHTIVL